MSILDFLIIAVIAVAVFFAVRRIIRMRKSGGCSCGAAGGGCSGCCAACSAECSKTCKTVHRR